jgi:hypothetical protein
LGSNRGNRIFGGWFPISAHEVCPWPHFYDTRDAPNGCHRRDWHLTTATNACIGYEEIAMRIRYGLRKSRIDAVEQPEQQKRDGDAQGGKYRPSRTSPEPRPNQRQVLHVESHGSGAKYLATAQSTRTYIIPLAGLL